LRLDGSKLTAVEKEKTNDLGFPDFLAPSLINQTRARAGAAACI